MIPTFSTPIVQPNKKARMNGPSRTIHPGLVLPTTRTTNYRTKYLSADPIYPFRFERQSNATISNKIDNPPSNQGIHRYS